MAVQNILAQNDSSLQSTSSALQSTNALPTSAISPSTLAFTRRLRKFSSFGGRCTSGHQACYLPNQGSCSLLAAAPVHSNTYHVSSLHALKRLHHRSHTSRTGGRSRCQRVVPAAAESSYRFGRESRAGEVGSSEWRNRRREEDEGEGQTYDVESGEYRVLESDPAVGAAEEAGPAGKGGSRKEERQPNSGDDALGGGRWGGWESREEQAQAPRRQRGPRRVEYDDEEEEEGPAERERLSLWWGDEGLAGVVIATCMWLLKASGRATLTLQTLLPPAFPQGLLAAAVRGGIFLSLLFVVRSLLQVVFTIASVIMTAVLAIQALWAMGSFISTSWSTAARAGGFSEPYEPMGASRERRSGSRYGSYREGRYRDDGRVNERSPRARRGRDRSAGGRFWRGSSRRHDGRGQTTFGRLYDEWEEVGTSSGEGPSMRSSFRVREQARMPWYAALWKGAVKRVRVFVDDSGDQRWDFDERYDRSSRRSKAEAAYVGSGGVTYRRWHEVDDDFLSYGEAKNDSATRRKSWEGDEPSRGDYESDMHRRVKSSKKSPNNFQSDWL